MTRSLTGRTKVAIVGFCQTSREIAPYEDPSFEIWGLNRGAIFMPRADRWFEMHGQHIFESQQRRPGKHLQWLCQFKGPVYMHKPFPMIPTCEVYPLREIADNIGEFVYRIGHMVGEDGEPVGASDGGGTNGQAQKFDPSGDPWDTRGIPYISSSIAYEIALAIYEGFEEIHLYGVDLNTESEYAWQKPGVEYLLGLAAGRGIKIVLPDNCPLLKGTLYGRGFMSERGEKMSYEQLSTRLTALQHDHTLVQKELYEIMGGHREVDFLLEQLIPGIDHERLEDRKKKMSAHIQQLQAKALQIEGMINETSYWIHQTMEGQQPKEAIDQLGGPMPHGRPAFEDADGPLTQSDVLHSMEPAFNAGAMDDHAASGGDPGNVVSIERWSQNGHNAEAEVPIGAP